MVWQTKTYQKCPARTFLIHSILMYVNENGLPDQNVNENALPGHLVHITLLYFS